MLVDSRLTKTKNKKTLHLLLIIELIEDDRMCCVCIHQKVIRVQKYAIDLCSPAIII